MRLYKGNVLVDRWLADPSTIDKASLLKVHEYIEEWRERLGSISWFMRGVNETIARMAHLEEGCSGRFWEGRFKSQALLDEAAVLSCMAYVDLNPVRAGMEKDLYDSNFTSIQQRLYNYTTPKKSSSKVEQGLTERISQQQELKQVQGLGEFPEASLVPFDGGSYTNIQSALPFTREDYFELVDVTGRNIRGDKRGAIYRDIPSIVERLGIEPDYWIAHIQNFCKTYSACVGSVDAISDYASKSGKRWCKGITHSMCCYRQVG